MEDRIERLTTLLNEGIEFLDDAPFGSDAWAWLQQAKAAAENKCILCSCGCNDDGDCVNAECKFGLATLEEIGLQMRRAHELANAPH